MANDTATNRPAKNQPGLASSLELIQSLTNAGKDYLAEFPSMTAARGAGYFHEGRVSELHASNLTEFRSVVRGSDDYEQAFSFKGKGWQSRCSCPVSVECKHLFAAMRAYLQHLERVSATQARAFPQTSKSPSALPSTAGSPLATAKPEASAKPQASAKPDQLREKKKSKLSLLTESIEQMLNRPANTAELEWIGRLHQVFCEVRQMKVIYTYHLSRLIGEAHFDDDMPEWSSLKPWTEMPEDAWTFWQYLAFFFQERNVEISAPATILEVTDTSEIASRRRAEIRIEKMLHVETSAKYFLQSKSSLSSPRVFEARLVVTRKRLFVEGRSGETDAFHELTRSVLRGLCGEGYSLPQNVRFDKISQSAEVIISLLNDSGAGYSSYNGVPEPGTEEAGRWAARILESRFADLLLVDESRQPLKRSGKEFNWVLTHDAVNHDAVNTNDFSLDLVTATGERLPEAIAVIDGAPAVIITEGYIHELSCPLPSGLEVGQSNLLSHDFVTSQAGLDFLTALGAKLTPDLETKFPVVRLSARIEASLQKISAAGEERLQLEGKAGFGGEDYFIFSSFGWRVLKSPRERATLRVDSSGIPQLHSLFSSLKLPPLGELGAFRVTKNFPERFSEWLAAVPPSVEVPLLPPLDSFRTNDLKGTARLEVTPLDKVDWFDLMLVVDVEATHLSKEEISLLTSAKGKFVRLSDGGWYRLRISLSPEDEARLKQLGLAAEGSWERPRRIHRVHLALPELRDYAPHEVASRLVKAGSVACEISKETAQLSILRPYQREGVDFLGFLASNGLGGILADDMGLGKTIQTLTWLEWLTRNSAKKNGPPHLIVCPKSVLGNWVAEAKRFCPGLKFKIVTSADCAQLAISRREFDAVVTGYSVVRQHEEEFCALDWNAVVLDEGQMIKNPSSQISLLVCQLQSAHRLVLSGTPIENRLLDLWSLFRFCMPGLLGAQSDFKKTYGGAVGAEEMKFLGALVRPFILRRSKALVAKDLPEKTEIDRLCVMEGTQNRLYQAELKRAQQMLLAVKTQAQLNKIRFHVFSSLLRLRQICCHPKLVDEGLKAEQSAKLEALLEIVESIASEGNKVLVFSQFTEMLDLVAAVLKDREIGFLTLTGKTENRTELVAEFQNSPSVQVFLISLRAGGFGLNLTAASYVVLFEPWWNPAVENQAIDRTHRIGQTSPVTAYRLLVKDSIEEKMRLLHQKKTGLAAGVLDEEAFSRALTVDDFRFLVGAFSEGAPQQ